MIMPRAISQSVEQLITGKAIVAEADRMGLKATDQDLRRRVGAWPLLADLVPGRQVHWRTGLRKLAPTGESDGFGFRGRRKERNPRAEACHLITGSASVSDAEIRQEVQKRSTKVKFDYAVLSQDDIRKGLHPTDEELKAFYTRNQARYKDSIPRSARSTMSSRQEQDPRTGAGHA